MTLSMVCRKVPPGPRSVPARAPLRWPRHGGDGSDGQLLSRQPARWRCSGANCARSPPQRRAADGDAWRAVLFSPWSLHGMKMTAAGAGLDGAPEVRGAAGLGELVQRSRCSMVRLAVLEPAALASRQRSAGRSRHEAPFSLRTVPPWAQGGATAAQSPQCSLDPLRGAARDPSELRLTTRASIPVA